jgi:hypothetical protein
MLETKAGDQILPPSWIFGEDQNLKKREGSVPGINTEN